MGIPTLITTLTAADDVSLSFVDGTADVTFDSTYDEYMFVCTDINPVTSAVDFTFQVNATDDAGGGYDTSQITSTFFRATHREDGVGGAVDYMAGGDQAQGTAFQLVADYLGAAADESCAGILHLFRPSSTDFVKHFYSRFHLNDDSPTTYADDNFCAGYINDATAIDEIQFKMSSGNFDGVIQMYGIA